MKPSATVQWPRSRGLHSSAVISSTLSNGAVKHYLLVLGGGAIEGTVIVPDCWVMDIDNKKWKQVLQGWIVTGLSLLLMSTIQPFTFAWSKNSINDGFWLNYGLFKIPLNNNLLLFCLPLCSFMFLCTWMLFQIPLPESVTTRQYHSMTAFRMRANRVWLMVTGGYNRPTTAVTSPNILILVELGMSLVNVYVWIIVRFAAHYILLLMEEEIVYWDSQ